MIGGILFNLIFAYFILILVFAAGLPKSEFLYPLNAIPKIETVEKESPAAKAGLQVGDRIISVNDTQLNNDTSKLLEFLRDNAGKTLNLVIERAKILESIQVTLDSKTAYGKTIGYLGTSFSMVDVPGSTLLQAIKQGINITNRYILATMYMFKYIFTKRDTSGVGGPVMIIQQTAQGHQKASRPSYYYWPSLASTSLFLI